MCIMKRIILLNIFKLYLSSQDKVRLCQMLGFGVKLASGPWVGGPPPLSHISHSFFWLHRVTFLLSWNGSSVTWSREVSSRRTGLSAPALPLRGPLPRVREEQRDEAPRTTQERGNHLMAVPTAPLQDHICLELNPASNPLWPPSALSTESRSSAWQGGAPVACLLASSPSSSLPSVSWIQPLFHRWRS